MQWLPTNKIRSRYSLHPFLQPFLTTLSVRHWRHCACKSLYIPCSMHEIAFECQRYYPCQRGASRYFVKQYIATRVLNKINRSIKLAKKMNPVTIWGTLNRVLEIFQCTLQSQLIVPLPIKEHKCIPPILTSLQYIIICVKKK